MFQDTFNGSASDEPFFTSVASITVHVKDVDNRPPWFQPCLRTNLGIAKLCVSGGYRGRVNLTEKEVSLSSLASQHLYKVWNLSYFLTVLSSVKNRLIYLVIVRKQTADLLLRCEEAGSRDFKLCDRPLNQSASSEELRAAESVVKV